MQTMENFILQMNNYCKFEGDLLPIGLTLCYQNAKSKVRRLLERYPHLLIQCFCKAVHVISDKASHHALVQVMTTYIPLFSNISKGTNQLTHQDFAEFFSISLGKLRRESFKP